MGATDLHEKHSSEKFLIIIAEDTKNTTEYLNDVFQLLWKTSLLDSNVLFRDENKFWSLYTFMPFQNDCLSLGIIKFTTFTPSNFTNNMTVPMDLLYRKKLKNFNNCPLYVGVSVAPALLYIGNTSNDQIQYRGLDIDVLNHISSILNFRIEYKLSPDGRGMIHPNGTVTGTLNLVIK